MTDKTPKPPRGRPARPDLEKMTKRLPVVQLFESQLEAYAIAAELEGKSKSEWVRDTLDERARIMMLLHADKKK